MSFESEKFIRKYNQRDYYIELKIHNPTGDEWVLNPMAIEYLEIVDDIHQWPTCGFFIYGNPHEVNERVMAPPSETVGTNPAIIQQTVNAKKPYLFRNDGRDFLDITIYMVDPENKMPKKQWLIQHKCVIYDKEDLSGANITQKMKKYYFWDADFQKMQEEKIQWSTATSTLNPTYRMLGSKYKPMYATDEERKMPTGDIMKSILQDNGFKCSVENFDTGSTKLFYSTFNDKNIWENLDYVLHNHLSTKSTTTLPLDDGDICIFDKDRYTGEFELQPLNKIFSKAGNQPDVPKEYQTELLHFEESVGEASTSPSKAPTNPDFKYDVGYVSGTIKSYQFVDMAGSVNSNMIVTTPVHTYDFANKTFSINTENSNVDILYKKIQDKYIKGKVLAKGSYPLLSLNKTKTENKTINPVYSVRSDRDAINRMGMGSLLHWALFLNECLSFQIMGLPIRGAGRFIGVDRMSFSDNKMDYKLLGQWYVTKVKHIFFNNGSYINDVMAVKLHSYDDLGIDKNIK